MSKRPADHQLCPQWSGSLLLSGYHSKSNKNKAFPYGLLYTLFIHYKRSIIYLNCSIEVTVLLLGTLLMSVCNKLIHVKRRLEICSGRPHESHSRRHHTSHSVLQHDGHSQGKCHMILHSVCHPPVLNYE